MDKGEQKVPERTMTPEQFRCFGEAMGHAWDNYATGIDQAIKEYKEALEKIFEERREAIEEVRAQFASTPF